jgi:hypothetical protein
MNMVRVKIALLAVAGLLIIAQFLQPRRTNPPVIPSRSLAAHVAVPEQVQSILRKSCSDCHSNQTVWPWYGHIAPFSWVITDDVNEGRRHINFQDWEAQEGQQQASDHLAAICKEVRDDGMPLPWYRIMHPDTKLNSQEKDILCAWSQTFGPPVEPAGKSHP